MVVQGGYEIPAGSIIFCHHRLAALQEENFTRATEFIPGWKSILDLKK